MRLKYSAGQKVAQFVGLGVLGSGVCGGLLLYRHDQTFYRSLSSALHKLCDGETAHRLAVLALSKGLYFRSREANHPDISVKLWGLHFNNPVGVAAGFDKHGEAVSGLADIGFGFVEVGSVTPQPQEGNPKPRVFRLDSDEAVINRYGFNSQGHLEVRRRLELLRAGGFNGILGINLGKNKSSVSAAEDYVAGVRQFSHLADYLVINISSPNTPGLRSLQARQQLKSLLQSVLAARRSLKLARPPPLLLKISPDLSRAELEDIAEVVTAPDSRVDGLVISNTTVSRPDLASNLREEEGGLSGAPLRSLSTGTISTMYSLTGGNIPIVGVGGVNSGAEAWEKVKAGASLVQVYTGLVYQGPPLVTRIRRDLRDLVVKEGYLNMQEAVGAAHSRPD